MKRLLLPLLAAFALPTAVNAGMSIENISFKSIVINRLLIGLEVFTIMLVN